ncbi:MAG: ATP synthase F1 subunit delta [Spirochaetes bacterium RBG_13_51_14]|nr:MAG: ATP synthase F1 subunit delta [Spirochaetes bacterium RBG_13_51_14]
MAAKDIARVYASSLAEFGQNKNILSDVEEEIKFIAGLVTENRDLRQLLISPGIARDTKKAFIEKIFKGRLSDYTVNFLKVLIDNDRQSGIVDIYEALVAFIDETHNRQRVTVISSVPLDSSLKNKLAARLKEVMKKDVILHEEINAEILGGIIVKVGDTVFDGSLAKDLRNIKNNLLNSKVRSEAAYED